MAEYIEREAVIDLITRRYENPEICTAEINAIPAADVAPVVHGRWVQSGQCNHKPCRIRNTDKWTTYKCSVCGYSNGRRFSSNYCPNCGARMDGE